MRQQHTCETLIPLPYIPSPQADELISSWIARIASYYDLHSTEFLGYIGWTGKDLDFDPALSDLRKLSDYTHYPVHLIWAMSLKARYPKRRKTDFFGVMPVSNHLPIHCAACFERDIRQGRQPYWRYHWASFWSSQCKIDRFLLLDNCETMACYLSGNDPLRFLSCPFCKDRPHYLVEDAQPHHLSSSMSATDGDKVIKASYKSGCVLEEFEKVMDRALDGISPGPQWWCGHSATAFRRVVTDLVPFIIQRQEPYESPHLYPAKNYLRYNGMDFRYGGGLVLNYRNRGGLATVSEEWRHIALETLARIMMLPTQICFMQFMRLYPSYYYKHQSHHDLLHVYLSLLSNDGLQQLAAVAENWPRQAQPRIQEYLSKKQSYYLG